MRSQLIALGALFALNVSAQNFNNDWLFTESDSPDYRLTTYEPKEWRSLDLPHDWSIEHPFRADLEGCTAFSQGGIGWYTKMFDTEISNNQKCYVIFDGVYNNAEFWINGMKIGDHPYGYAPIYYDLTALLAPKGKENRISVRVDHSRYADSRWYTGSGIYRNVSMLVVDKLHIPVWGTFITTPEVSEEKARLNINVELKNDYSECKRGVIISEIFDRNGKKVGEVSSNFELGAGETTNVVSNAELKNPQLWSIENPNLYTVKNRLISDDKCLEERNTTIGVRSLHFDNEKGFFLNGENVKIKGVCLHHDAGMVGSAVPKDVWRRRLVALKEMGCNAIRSAHNPTSDEFLDLCDELGILVQNEFYDEWDLPKDKRYNMQDKEVDYITRGHSEHFQAWAETDLKNVMKSSRNHPSVFQWSIGNEIEWTYPGNRTATGLFKGTNNRDKMDWTLWRVSTPPNSPEQVREFWANYPEQTFDMGRTAKKLAAWTREMDTTRPIVANLILPTSSMETEYADVLDVIGFSYKPEKYDYFKSQYPDRIFLGTENVPRWYEWKAALERDYIAGIFLWTGVDYMGECRVRSWPVKVTPQGPLDIAAFPRGSYYAFQSFWTDKPVLEMYSQTEQKSIFKKAEGNKAEEKKKGYWELAPREWQKVNPYWSYEDGEACIVEVYSNCEEVELFQNGKSLGKQMLADQDDRIYKWALDYKKGKVEARGRYKGKKVSTQLETPKEATAIKLTPDRATMKANNTDVLHVVAQIVDKKGNAIKNVDTEVTFEIDGDHRFLGTDCGNTALYDTFKSHTVKTQFGRCLLAIQATDNADKITITARSRDGLTSEVMDFVIQ